MGEEEVLKNGTGMGASAAGAAVGAVGYGVGKAVEKVIDIADGKEGSMMLINKSSETVSFYSYDYNDRIQLVSRSSIVLSPGQWGNLSAAKGFGTFGAECEEFRICAYIDGKFCQPDVMVKVGTKVSYSYSAK